MGDSNPRKVTFNLKPRSQVALERILTVTGEDMTDAINGALRLYAMVLQEGPDAQLFLRHPARGLYERTHLP